MAITIALVGNPNCGKTTMFNDLTGSNQYVGNWPGVTVEKKEGRLKGHKDVIITDLPGIYSLSPYTLEEVVSRDYLTQHRPDVILNLVDGTNLERNLYLTTQLMEIGIPVVVAINMMDLVKKKGDRINTLKLSEQLGCEVVETSALKGDGSFRAAERAIVHAKSSAPPAKLCRFSQATEQTLSSISDVIRQAADPNALRWHAIKLFERDDKAAEQLHLSESAKREIHRLIASEEKMFDDDSESILINERYDYITDLTRKCCKKRPKSLTPSDKIDRVLTNRWLALPIFVLIISAVYFISVSWLGAGITDWTNDVFFGEWIQPGVQGFLETVGAADWLIGLIVDGIIAGVGAVLGFVPQMFILFFFLSILEDCGYMARVAFIMDRIFRKIGLSGKSFIPLLIASGCGVPGIMASKTIENEKDRRMTIITTTFIPCGAKLPVIALVGGSIFGATMWWLAPLMYFVGIAAVVVSGLMLKKTKMFSGKPAPFVMELPSYHLPAAKSVWLHMWERVRAFIIKAGTIIFIASALIWFLSNFGFSAEGFSMVANESDSMLAAVGAAIAPIFAPLGFGKWQTTMATLSGLIAKENIVSTLSVLFGLSDAAQEGAGLWANLAQILPHAAAALSFLLFNLLCAPCIAAMGAIRREMASAKWTAFAIGYQTVFAYCVALMTYQFGGLLTGVLSFNVWTAAAILIFAAFVYLLIRPGYQKHSMKTIKISHP